MTNTAASSRLPDQPHRRGQLTLHQLSIKVHLDLDYKLQSSGRAVGSRRGEGAVPRRPDHTPEPRLSASSSVSTWHAPAPRTRSPCCSVGRPCGPRLPRAAAGVWWGGGPSPEFTEGYCHLSGPSNVLVFQRRRLDSRQTCTCVRSGGGQ